MTIANGGRHTKQTRYPAVLWSSRDALWQSGTSELVHRAMLFRVYGSFRRDRILFRVGLSLTRHREEPPGPVAAPSIVDRFHDSSVVAGHGRQDRPDVWHREALGAAGLPARGLQGLVKPRHHEIRPAFVTQC